MFSHRLVIYLKWKTCILLAYNLLLATDDIHDSDPLLIKDFLHNLSRSNYLFLFKFLAQIAFVFNTYCKFVLFPVYVVYRWCECLLGKSCPRSAAWMVPVMAPCLPAPLYHCIFSDVMWTNTYTHS